MLFIVIVDELKSRIYCLLSAGQWDVYMSLEVHFRSTYYDCSSPVLEKIENESKQLQFIDGSLVFVQ